MAGATLVQSKTGTFTGGGSTTGSVSFTSAPTSGNTLLVAVFNNGALLDSFSGVELHLTAIFTRDLTVSIGTNVFAEVWRLDNDTSAVTQIDVQSSSGAPTATYGIWIMEWSGINATPKDQTGTAGSASQTAETVTASGATAQADELVIAVCANNPGLHNAGFDPGTPSGYTALADPVAGNMNARLAYKVLTATATPSATFATLPGSSPVGLFIISYKSASAGGTFLPPPNKPILQAVKRAAYYCDLSGIRLPWQSAERRRLNALGLVPA